MLDRMLDLMQRIRFARYAGVTDRNTSAPEFDHGKYRAFFSGDMGNHGNFVFRENTPPVIGDGIRDGLPRQMRRMRTTIVVLQKRIIPLGNVLVCVA